MLRFSREIAELFLRLLLLDFFFREEVFELFFRAMGLKPKYCSNYSMWKKQEKLLFPLAAGQQPCRNPQNSEQSSQDDFHYPKRKLTLRSCQ